MNGFPRFGKSACILPVKAISLKKPTGLFFLKQKIGWVDAKNLNELIVSVTQHGHPWLRKEFGINAVSNNVGLKTKSYINLQNCEFIVWSVNYDNSFEMYKKITKLVFSVRFHS